MENPPNVWKLKTHYQITHSLKKKSKEKLQNVLN